MINQGATKISAFVISFNGERTIKACLSSLSFADEIILVDKSSTDKTVELANGLCDKVFIVPWSPTVEETRAFAASQCRNDWIVFLDDDEILNAPAIDFASKLPSDTGPQIFGFARKEYIIGRHSEGAYYWPNWQIRMFHKDALLFTNKVHDGYTIKGKVTNLPVDTGVRVEHLSHPDVSTFIEKTNRYTSQPDRHRFSDGTEDIVSFAHSAIDRWAAKAKNDDPRSYERAVSILMAAYEIVDALKVWEEKSGVNGKEEFARISAELSSPAKKRYTRVTGQSNRSLLRKLFHRG